MQRTKNKLDKIMTKQVSMGPPKPGPDLLSHSPAHQIMLLARATDTILLHATPRASMQISRNYDKSINFIGNIDKSEKHTFSRISKNSSESACLKEESAPQSTASAIIALCDRKPCRVASDKINEKQMCVNTGLQKHASRLEYSTFSQVECQMLEHTLSANFHNNTCWEQPCKYDELQILRVGPVLSRFFTGNSRVASDATASRNSPRLSRDSPGPESSKGRPRDPQGTSKGPPSNP